MPINLAQEVRLLQPGLRDVIGRYDQIPTQWDKVFDRGTSQMAFERTAEEAFMPLGKLKTEGGAVEFDNTAGDRFVYNQQHITIGLGYAITREAIEDNLYKDKFEPTNLGLNESFAQTKEIIGANILNNGTTYNPQVVGDGVALFSTLHPIDGNVYANMPASPLSLNEGALESAELTIRYFPDQKGLRMMARGRKLVVPPQLEYTALRLLKSELRPATANNDINAQITGGFLPDGILVMDFLTSAFAWFVRSDKPGLLYLERRAYEGDMQADFTTQTLMVLATERYSFGENNPRAIYGSYPTA